MAISFNNGGGSLWFTLLSIYVTLCSLCLYHVQSSMATISWIDRSSRDGVVVDDDPTAQLRRQWDPGIPKHIYATSCSLYFHIQSSMSTASWINHSGHSYVNVTMALRLRRAAMMPCVTVFRFPAPAAARNESMAWHPGIRSACRNTRMLRLTRYRHSISADRPKTHDVASVGLLFCEAPTSATVQSIFHYSHPVLSRPTVPNIDT